MAPVVAIRHVHDVDHADDGRHECGPYDNKKILDSTHNACKNATYEYRDKNARGVRR